MTIPLSNLELLLNTAEMAANQAGAYLVKGKSTSMCEVESDAGRDVKLAADKHSERIILDVLQETEIPILTEESGFICRTGNETLDGIQWIVDPLDGSLNFFRSIPLCCVSIGLWQNITPLLGVVYDFIRDERFTGIRSAGAWLNGMPITPSHTSSVNKAVLCTGFPVNTDFSTKALARFITGIKEHKKIRLMGSAALSLAYVAAGRADAYTEKAIMLWDIAGGLAVLNAAGGIFHLDKAEKTNAFDVYASTSYLAQ